MTKETLEHLSSLMDGELSPEAGRFLARRMATDESLSLTAGADIPIGHKVAVKDLSDGDTAIKYGEDIGKIIAAVSPGGHVHTHNLKTKRW